MRILLVGNGLDLTFTDELSKERMIEKILYGKKEFEGKTYRTEYPLKLNDFWNSNFKEPLVFTSKELSRIRGVLVSEISAKSIETIYNQISSFLGKDSKRQLLEMFKKYIELKSHAISIKNIEKSEQVIKIDDTLGSIKRNYLGQKLKGYDIIITTNYDDLIERILKEWNTNNNEPEDDCIVHIHGDLKNNDIFVGDKDEQFEAATKVALSHLDELNKLNYQYNPDKDPKIELDIYGWSFTNEEDIIGLIVEKAVQLIYCDLNENNRAKIAYADYDVRKATTKLFTINYYFYNEADLEDAMNSKYIEYDNENKTFKKTINVRTVLPVNMHNENTGPELIDYSLEDSDVSFYGQKQITRERYTRKSTGIINVYDSSYFLRDNDGNRLVYSKIKKEFFNVYNIRDEYIFRPVMNEEFKKELSAIEKKLNYDHNLEQF